MFLAELIPRLHMVRVSRQTKERSPEPPDLPALTHGTQRRRERGGAARINHTSSLFEIVF